jgi:hypothetical protein
VLYRRPPRPGRGVGAPRMRVTELPSEWLVQLPRHRAILVDTSPSSWMLDGTLRPSIPLVSLWRMGAPPAIGVSIETVETMFFLLCNFGLFMNSRTRIFGYPNCRESYIKMHFRESFSRARNIFSPNFPSRNFGISRTPRVTTGC